MIEKGIIKAELIDHMGSDLSVVNAARVSFAKESKELNLKDEKLIRYLAKHNHWSPFAHPQLQFRYTVPMPVARQEFKHIVGFVRNEVSRRYVDDTPTFFLPDEWRAAPTDGAKQGSSSEIIHQIRVNSYRYDTGNDPDESWEGIFDIDDFVEEGYEDALFRYNTLIENRVAPELARIVLPQGVFTSYIVTGSLAAFARFVNQRMDPHAQKEIRTLAEITAAQIEPLFPYSWKELVKNV